MVNRFPYFRFILHGIWVVALISGIPSFLQAEVKLPFIFSDHMVLQQDLKIPIWGWADPGEEVKVLFAGQSVTTKVGSNGKWRVDLENVGVNATGQTLTVIGKNTLKFEDVLVGDVWVCSGQSNMGLYLAGDYRAKEEVPKANDPLLRLFTISEQSAIEPKTDIKSNMIRPWQECTLHSANIFTAVGYYFGKELRSDLKKPIGLISCPYGGTMLQGWISVSAVEKKVDAVPECKEWLELRNKRVAEYPQRLAEYGPLKEKFEKDISRWANEVEKAPEFLQKLKVWEEENKKALLVGKPPLPRPQPSEPRPKDPEPPDGGSVAQYMVGNLYNAMIAPIMPYGIKGVIWYQGEGGGHLRNGRVYAALFPVLISDWREKWGQGDFPFLFVQLPNGSNASTEPVEGNVSPYWPGAREAQASALSLPNTGMATTIDIGDPYDVHGKDKIDVGVRLSLIARKIVYGQNIVYTGPTYHSMKIVGDKIRITFKNTGSGLTIGVPPWTPSGVILPMASEVKGFAIAGVDQKWHWAKAEIEGDDVMVSSSEVSSPVAVRYGWANNPPCNLYNKEKLPATPFRTDKWEL